MFLKFEVGEQFDWNLFSSSNVLRNFTIAVSCAGTQDIVFGEVDR